MKTTALSLFGLLLAALPSPAQTPQYAPAPALPLQYAAEAMPSAAVPIDPITGACPNGYRTLHCTPEYYFQADCLIWSRRMPTGALLINQYTGETVTDYRDVAPPRWMAGPNLTVGRALWDCWSAEINYFGLWYLGSEFTSRTGIARPIVPDPTDASRLIAAEILPFPNFRIAGAPAFNFDPRDTQNYAYNTSINNFELNLRKDVSDRFSWIVGFRYISLVENLHAQLFDRFGQAYAGYSIGTENNLFGGQLGADYTAPLCDPLYVRFSGKAGLFGNAASQNTFGTFLGATTVNQQNAPGGRDGKDGQLSFVGQANLNFIYEITPRVHIRAGYSAFLITGVATAPDQTTASDFSRGGRGGVNTSGNAFYHGMNFGFEYHH